MRRLRASGLARVTAGARPTAPARAPVRNPAVRAEPSGIGSAGARDPLRREVKLLGALLGQVLVEQAGMPLLELVERVRRRTIALRRPELDEADRARLAEELGRELDALDLDQLEALVRAFGLYFQLVNLAEERHRIRTLRRRERAAPRGALEGSLADAVRRLWRAGRRTSDIAALAARLDVRARPHGAPDRGATADPARGPPTLRRAPRASRRSAPDP